MGVASRTQPWLMVMVAMVLVPSWSHQWIIRVKLCTRERVGDIMCDVDANGVEHLVRCEWMGEGDRWEGKRICRVYTIKTARCLELIPDILPCLNVY